MGKNSDDSARVPRSYDDELRDRALKRLKAKGEFREHLTSYVVVNGFLVAIWAMTGRGYFWPIWPILGWGVGIAFHALSLRWDDGGPTAAQVEAQAERLRARDQRLAAASPPVQPAAPGVLADQASHGSGVDPAPGSGAAGPGPWDLTPGPQDAR